MCPDACTRFLDRGPSQAVGSHVGDRAIEHVPPRRERVAVALRLLDDGAWLSVNDERRVSVGELWRLDDPAYCDCALTEFAVEGFTDCRVVGRTVTVTAYGTCILCGTADTTTGVPVGRVRRGSFHDLDRETAVLAPHRAARSPRHGDS